MTGGTTALQETLERHPGWQRTFSPGRLSLGIFFPIEADRGGIPKMRNQLTLARRAEELGFAALWVRDVPLHDPAFGDVGQIFDPFVYLTHVAARTEKIALATGSIIFPLRHPLHLAKAASSVDQLSGGRLVLGIGTGDRPIEYPAFGVDFEARGERFRETVSVFRRASEGSFPTIKSPLGETRLSDLLPKPYAGRVPLLITGSSRQSPEWIAAHGDGWLSYPQSNDTVRGWHALVERGYPGRFKPFAQPLHIDLADDPELPPSKRRVETRLGSRPLVSHLDELRCAGVNHVALNLRFSSRPVDEVIEELGEEVLPHFPSHQVPDNAFAG